VFEVEYGETTFGGGESKMPRRWTKKKRSIKIDSSSSSLTMNG